MNWNRYIKDAIESISYKSIALSKEMPFIYVTRMSYINGHILVFMPDGLIKEYPELFKDNSPALIFATDRTANNFPSFYEIRIKCIITGDLVDEKDRIKNRDEDGVTLKLLPTEAEIISNFTLNPRYKRYISAAEVKRVQAYRQGKQKDVPHMTYRVVLNKGNV